MRKYRAMAFHTGIYVCAIVRGYLFCGTYEQVKMVCENERNFVPREKNKEIKSGKKSK
jgi:hypothetical protein